MRGNRTKRPFLPQPRDLQLLRALGQLKVADRAQAQMVGGFLSVTRANTRFPKLAEHKLISRMFIPTEHGGKKAIYTLTPTGAAAAGVSFQGIRRAKNTLLIADPFIPHQLRINEIYLLLKHRPIPIDGVSFACWRAITEPLSVSAPIIPDAYFEILSPAKTVCSFLEVDLGGETAKIWKSKIQSYINLAVYGDFEQLFHHQQFRVVVVANSPGRAESIRKLVAYGFTDKVFWISDFETIKRDGFWGNVWVRPANSSKQSFLGDLQ
jgi:hypothetical protein